MNEEIDSKSVPEELELSSELQYITSGEVSEPIEIKSEVNESDDSFNYSRTFIAFPLLSHTKARVQKEVVSLVEIRLMHYRVN